MKLRHLNAPFLLMMAVSLSSGCADETQKDVGSNAMDSSLDQSVSLDGGLMFDAASSTDMSGLDQSQTDASQADVSLSDAQPQQVDAQAMVDMNTTQRDSEVEPWRPEPTSLAPIIADPGPDLELLIVGDNYVGFNDLCAKIIALADAAGRWENVVCEVVSSGGFRLINHADTAASMEECEEDTTCNVLRDFLNAQDPTRMWFDLMILQERAQGSGFPRGQQSRDEFEQAVEELAIRGASAGMPTALLMTWGRYDDPNTSLYPDYVTMQRRIAEAHYAVADAVTALGQTVSIIEAGEVWFRVHERSVPDFFSLMLPDDHHPTDVGSWLLAGTILSRAVGLTPNWPLVSGLPPRDLWLRLQGDVIQE